MPPKAKTPATTGEDDADKGFRWTTENDKKLLMIMVCHVDSTTETTELVKKWPGSTYNGIRIRRNKLRREAEAYVKELGFVAGPAAAAAAAPTSTPAAPAKPGRGKKRAAAAEEGLIDDDEDTGFLKRSKVGTKKGKNEEEEEEEEELGVKEELEENVFE